MNSIGVDFKLKNVEIEGKMIKLQIVLMNLILFSGIQPDKSDSAQSQLVTIEELMQL